MTTMFDTLKHPNGDPARSVTVEIRKLAPKATDEVHDSTNQETVVGLSKVRTTPAGRLEVDLRPSDDLTPTGSMYQAVWAHGADIHYDPVFSVPATGDHWIGANLESAPAALLTTLEINWQGAWALGTDYTSGQSVNHNNESFISLTDHEATADNEPGQGANWEDHWDYLVRVPSGLMEEGDAAGGDLGGTYPDPTLSSAKQAELDGKQDTSEKDQAGGYAGLDGSGKIQGSAVPAIGLSEYLGEVADEPAMLALSGQTGDWVKRNDENRFYILTTTGGSQASDWVGMPTPGEAIVQGEAAGGDLSGTYPNPSLSSAKQTEIDDKVAAGDFDAKGDLQVGTGADTYSRLPVGSDGEVLKANSAVAEGVEWGTGGGGSVDSEFDAKGDLLIGTGANAKEILPVGSDGQTLRANSAASGGASYQDDAIINPSHAPYLAAGDDTTDDTAALNSAGSAAKVLILQQGKTYYVAGKLTWSDVKVFAHGATLRFDYATTGDEGAIEPGSDVSFLGGSWDFDDVDTKFGIFADTAISKIRVRHCEFTGAFSHCIAFNDAASDCAVEDCDFDGFVSGVRIRGGVSEMRVRRCKFTDWKTYGIEVRAVAAVGEPSDVKITGNYWGFPGSWDPNTNGVAKQPLACFGESGAKTRGLEVSFNTAIGPGEAFSHGTDNRGTADQLSVHYADGLVFVGNISLDGGENGVSITREVTNAIITGNLVAFNDGHGIQVGTATFPADDVAIGNNICHDNGQDRLDETPNIMSGLFVRNVSHVMITGNECYGSATQAYGLTLHDCTTVNLMGNDFSNNNLGRINEVGTVVYNSYWDGNIMRVGSGNGSPRIYIDGAAGERREFRFLSDGVDRWHFICSSASESGGNSGSDFDIQPKADDGTGLGVALKIFRADSRVRVGGALGVNGKNPTTPNLPASPSVQDIADALVTIGLVTQS